jgi:hypothetical protein
MSPRRTKPKPPASGTPAPSKAGTEKFPHELRAGDVVLDENDHAWELLGRPTKVVGAQDFVTTMRSVDRPADVREGRWRAHERVRVRRA